MVAGVCAWSWSEWSWSEWLHGCVHVGTNACSAAGVSGCRGVCMWALLHAVELE